MERMRQRPRPHKGREERERDLGKGRQKNGEPQLLFEGSGRRREV